MRRLARMGCAWIIFLIAAVVMAMVSILRWFEQVTDAVDRGAWRVVILLTAVPPITWAFPGRVSAGRPSAVPRHEPVRGFGGLPKAKQGDPASAAPAQAPGAVRASASSPPTPPPRKARLPSDADAERVAKLREQMRRQGMLPPEE